MDALTEHDAKRLERLGFVRVDEYMDDTGCGDDFCEPDGWRVATIGGAISPALIGVLTEMCQKNQIAMLFDSLDGDPPVQYDEFSELWLIYANATPRQIFDALLGALEAQSSRLPRRNRSYER